MPKAYTTSICKAAGRVCVVNQIPKKEVFMSKAKYKYIFFDLDGTLTQSEFGIMAAAVRALNHFGIKTPSKEILKKFIGPPLYVSFHATVTTCATEEQSSLCFFLITYSINNHLFFLTNI